MISPLRRYLRKQVGRPWDRVWSEIAATLDRRTVSGQHIFSHIRSDVALNVWIGKDGRAYEIGSFGGVMGVSGLFVHPATGLLRDTRAKRAR